MSIVVRFPPGGTNEQYDEILRRVEESEYWPPDGLAFHVASGPPRRIYDPPPHLRDDEPRGRDFPLHALARRMETSAEMIDRTHGH